MKQDKKKDRLKKKEIKAYKKYKSAQKSEDGDKTEKKYDKLLKRQFKSLDGGVNVDYSKVAQNKSKQRVEKDYARNAIHDYETGHKSEANYEKKKELEVAAGEMHGYFASASKVHKHGKGRS